MPLIEAWRIALQVIWNARLRSFFTLLGIIVSVGFLVTVVAVIQGMNAYVRENISGAVIGTNAFQVRRVPIAIGLLTDDEVREIRKRPVISREDAEAVRRALPEAAAVSFQSGWPPPQSDVVYRNRTVGDVVIMGVTPPYQVVQDYRFTAGDPLSEIDVRGGRYVAVLGAEVSEELFGEPARAVGRKVRIAGEEMTVKGVIARKGRVLGQSFDGFALVPMTTFERLYGRRKTTTISVKVAEAEAIPGAMERAEEAMRIAHRLRPNEPDDFTVDKADALVSFWRDLTRVLFTVLPAVVCIGIVVGGIVIMNIMLMSVHERTREIGIRKSLGASRGAIRRQFLVEAVALATLGGVLGVAAGWSLSLAVAWLTPLPARITPWSVLVALALGTVTGVVFGVYPATRAARLDPVAAMRAE
jgi:putative ABC transport system permease protein